VTVIIAVLASILLPTLERAKETAARVRCLNAVRQLAIAVEAYAHDGEDYFPHMTSYHVGLVTNGCTTSGIFTQQESFR